MLRAFRGFRSSALGEVWQHLVLVGQFSSVRHFYVWKHFCKVSEPRLRTFVRIKWPHGRSRTHSDFRADLGLQPNQPRAYSTGQCNWGLLRKQKDPSENQRDRAAGDKIEDLQSQRTWVGILETSLSLLSPECVSRST